MAGQTTGNGATCARRAACVAAALAGANARPLAAQTIQQATEAAQQAVRRLDLQTDFPHGPEPLNFHVHLPEATIWVVIAIALGILLYAMRDLIPFWRAQSGDAWTQENGTPGDGGPGNQAMVLGEADELAAAGHFVEAMHVLLLQGLAHMRHRLDQQFSDSLTSREILRATTLPEAARGALRDVVDRVELTYFGKRPAALADYTACRDSFNALTQSLYGRAAA